jgi:hypothetical protein
MIWDRRGRDRMIVGFTTTCAININIKQTNANIIINNDPTVEATGINK